MVGWALSMVLIDLPFSHWTHVTFKQLAPSALNLTTMIMSDSPAPVPGHPSPMAGGCQPGSVKFPVPAGKMCDTCKVKPATYPDKNDWNCADMIANSRNFKLNLRVRRVAARALKKKALHISHFKQNSPICGIKLFLALV
jgi:hypothetical protein